VTVRLPAVDSGSFEIGGDLAVRRLGFGTMQLTGPGHWGPPADPDRAKAVLRRAVDLGINHFDTADAYGPHVTERLIREALHPYPADLVIATKGGLTRQGPGHWAPVGRPEYLRQCVELSLRRLEVDCIDLYYLHRIDPAVPLADQLGVLADCQLDGKIRHIGLSKVALTDIQAASETIQAVAVQNRFHLANQHSADVLRFCETAGIAFVPYAPLAAGQLMRLPSPVTELAIHTGMSAATLALAWLLARSPNMLPIPGTKRLGHLEENVAAAAVVPDDLLAWLHDQSDLSAGTTN
jgi:pyridoxine 4-dehydrogenase